jgi:UDP-glucose 4-epimerase
MNQILQGQPCTVFGDGMQTRAFTHISDIAPVIAKSVYHEKAFGQVFKIGADTSYSVTELVQMVQEAMGDTAMWRSPKSWSTCTTVPA